MRKITFLKQNVEQRKTCEVRHGLEVHYVYIITAPSAVLTASFLAEYKRRPLEGSPHFAAFKSAVILWEAPINEQKNLKLASAYTLKKFEI